MSEEKISCIENICYECCWYTTKIYTYIQEYLCCCCKKKIPYNSMDDTNIAKEQSPLIFNYDFIVIELKVNNKSYILNDYKQYMFKDKEFLKSDFVYDYLESKKNLKDIDQNLNYIISIMDNNSNFTTLDKNSYLLLKQNNYEKKILYHV